MDKELSEHTFKLSDEKALENLKELFEFTNPSRLRISLQKAFFSYLKEQADKEQDTNNKQVIVDFELLFDFLVELNSKN